MEARFVRVHNKYIRLDSIGYVDFLDSGRSMIFIPGLNQEKTASGRRARDAKAAARSESMEIEPEGKLPGPNGGESRVSTGVRIFRAPAPGTEAAAPVRAATRIGVPTRAQHLRCRSYRNRHAREIRPAQ